MSREGLVAVDMMTQARSVCAHAYEDAQTKEMKTCGKDIVSFKTHPDGTTLVFDADPLPMDSDKTVDGVALLFFKPQTHTHVA